MIEQNKAYIRRHGYGGDTLDELLVSAMTNDGHNKAVGFFDFTMKALVRFICSISGFFMKLHMH
jgi:hypothetical protein